MDVFKKVRDGASIDLTVNAQMLIEVYKDINSFIEKSPSDLYKKYRFKGYIVAVA